MQIKTTLRARQSIASLHPQGMTIHGGLQGAGTEGGRSVVQRGCMWQSSFPTATRPRGASPRLLWRSGSVSPSTLLIPFCWAPALSSPPGPPGSPGKAVAGPRCLFTPLPNCKVA